MQIKDEISSKTKKYFEYNKKTQFIKLWEAMKVVIRGKFTLFNVCFRRKERPKINHLSFHFRKVGKKAN